MNFKVVEARKAWCLQVYLLNWGYAFRWFFVINSPPHGVGYLCSRRRFIDGPVNI
jgi:hypothetical protein